MGSLPLRIFEACHRLGSFSFDVFKAPKPRLVYAGGYLGRNNLGDEALFLAYRKLFHQFGFIHYPCNSRVLKTYCNLFSPSKYVVLAGGTLINRAKEYLDTMQQCADLFPNSFIFGTGVADPLFWEGQSDWENKLKEWKSLLERCTYIGVRGPRSKEILSEIGIESDVIGDPVLALSDIETLKKANVEQSSIGFNIGNDGRFWGNKEHIKKEFIQLAILAKRADWKIKWFIVCPEDREMTLELAHASNTESDIVEICNDPITFMGVVQNLSVFVGMRLHSVVLTTCVFVPSIMLEYRPKCRDYMRSIEQECFTINTKQFNSEKVFSLMNDLNSHRNFYSKILIEKIGYLRDKQLRKVSELEKMIIENN